MPVKRELALLFPEGIIASPRPHGIVCVVDQPYQGPLQPKFLPFLDTLAKALRRPVSYFAVLNRSFHSLATIEAYLQGQCVWIDAVLWFGVKGRATGSIPHHYFPPLEEVIMDRSHKAKLWKVLKPYVRAE